MALIEVQGCYIVMVVLWLATCGTSIVTLSDLSNPQFMWEWWIFHYHHLLHYEWFTNVLISSPIAYFLTSVSGLREFCIAIWQTLVPTLALFVGFLPKCYLCLGGCLSPLFVGYLLGLPLFVVFP